MTARTGNSATTAELEASIKANADTDLPVETSLATSERIIARVTDGIYREPWAAFRELIANAYDADASYVVIETGQPDFHRLTVRDDGIGMSPKTLAYVLKNIGGSSKRTPVGAALQTVQTDAPELSPGGRRLIGKIGIGLFAVAQLTQHFQIITKAPGENHRLSATVTLRTHDEAAAQRDDTDYVAGTVKIVSQKVPDGEQQSHGTSVVLYQLRDEVRRTLQSRKIWEAAAVDTDGGDAVQRPPTFHIGHSLSDEQLAPNLPWDDSDTPTAKFDRFFKASGESTGRTTKSPNLDHFDEYLRLVWKLSLSLPLTYIAGHPFDLIGSDQIFFLRLPADGQAEPLVLSETESLRKRLALQTGRDATTPFAVTIDGIALRRPIRLPRTLAKPSRVGTPVMLAAKQENPFPEEALTRAGGRLSFEAYLYWNSKIVPKETTGVLVRICGASGTLFDPTFLNYQVSEQTRLRQITAEIFVREGLDGAINIDRESFNYSHPHFLFIQKWLHRALRLLANRLKATAKADLARHKASRRDLALAYASTIWTRRLGADADPPFTDGTTTSLPAEVGGTDIEWPVDGVNTHRGKPAGPTRVRSLAVILEAYGLLSGLDLDDRAQLIADIIGIPDTDA